MEVYGRILLLVSWFVLFSVDLTAQEIIDIQPDTWVATDALGRSMPGHDLVGPIKKDQRRVVGIFYITWHRDEAANKGTPPYQGDVTRILESEPDARLDGNHAAWTTNSYHWAEPELGYFLSRDEYVIRKDMSMLADAGVDVLVLDVTNAVRYWDEWESVFAVMEKMRSEGNRVPKFCFWAFNGPVITVVQELYDRIYKTGRFKEHWFYWDGKPLLLYNATPMVNANGRTEKHPNPNFDATAKTDPAHPHHADPAFTEPFLLDYTRDVKRFFTLRTMWWGYYHWNGRRFVGTEDNWSFGYDLGDRRVSELSPRQLLATHDGVGEQFAVTPAQHAVTKIGKSWTRATGEPDLDRFDLPRSANVPILNSNVTDPEAYGIYFQDRWDEAIAASPQFLYINDWNEWTAGKYAAPQGQHFNFMNRQSNFRFVDQYNAEFNRGIQPMKGGYTDNYYMQMAQNIRRYKGARPIPVHRAFRTIMVDGDLSDWKNVDVTYRDTIGDVAHRDFPGYHGLHYTNKSGRNDIVASQVAVDKDNLYFQATVRDDLTSPTGNHWMLLLIDADQNQESGWYGYDFIVNKTIIGERKTTLLRYDGATSGWVRSATLEFATSENALELKIPRNLLGLQENEGLRFDFHWADNPAELENPISLCVAGDSAPNRRFNYRFIWKGASD